MSNGSTPAIQSLPYCVEGFVNSVPPYIKITAAVSCALSVVGVLLILYTYVAYKKFRNKAREIILHISLMDFTVSVANFIGIVVDFDALLYNYENAGEAGMLVVHSSSSWFRSVNNLCIAQAAFAVYGTISSVLWTTALTVYFYFMIIGERARLAKRISYSFYFLCYGIPLLVIAWVGSTGKIGYSPVGGGGWCSLIFEKKIYAKDRFTIFFGYDLWMYITFIVVITATVSILTHLKTQVSYNYTDPFPDYNLLHSLYHSNY